VGIEDVGIEGYSGNRRIKTYLLESLGKVVGGIVGAEASVGYVACAASFAEA
jgi:hypothetical protein